MEKYSRISGLFYLAALYDGILGLAFLVAPLAVYAWFAVTPPNHVGYVHFPAALLLVFSLMFLNIARQPLINRNLIPYGVLLKVSYCAVVFYHWFSAGIPDMWKSFAIVDACFGGLFIWAYIILGRAPGKNSR